MDESVKWGIYGGIAILASCTVNTILHDSKDYIMYLISAGISLLGGMAFFGGSLGIGSIISAIKRNKQKNPQNEEHIKYMATLAEKIEESKAQVEVLEDKLKAQEETVE